MVVREGYSEYYPELKEVVNDSDSVIYIVYVCMGGSGFDIKEITPGSIWREGVGEEYIGAYITYKDADEGLRIYIEQISSRTIEQDNRISEIEKVELRKDVHEIIHNTSKSSEAAIKFQKVMSKVAITTAEALKEILVDIVAETIKRILWP